MYNRRLDAFNRRIKYNPVPLIRKQVNLTTDEKKEKVKVKAENNEMSFLEWEAWSAWNAWDAWSAWNANEYDR